MFVRGLKYQALFDIGNFICFFFYLSCLKSCSSDKNFRCNREIGVMQGKVTLINVISDGSLGVVQQRGQHGPMRWRSRGGARGWTDSP